MKYTGPVYRPPFEADSLLLQVTAGCSHNACIFCTMYADTPFRTESQAQIEEDLEEAARRWPHTDRVFLVNADPFALSAERLTAIAKAIHEKLPSVETIAMYAHINNIRNKSDDSLVKLRTLGINELNIGLESGLDEALNHLNKGYTATEALAELMRLKNAGIAYSLNIIFGAGGAENTRENARTTAALLNLSQPYLVFTSTLHYLPGCPLYDEIQAGTFKENTLGDHLEEEELLLRNLELKDSYYFGLHPSNVIPLEGRLPQDQERLIAEVSRFRASLSPQKLASIPKRYGKEGGIRR